jgi:hypothetical protein
MAINFDHSGAGTITIKSPTTGGSTLTLPSGNGEPGQVLTTDGSGNLNFSNINADVDLSGVEEDILPLFSEVYDIGSEDKRWYNGYFSNKIDINNIELSNTSDNDLKIKAETTIIDGDLLANSLLLDGIFINDNIIKPLSTHLYGQKEIVVDGGLHISTEEPSYIRLTQEIPTENDYSILKTYGSEGMLRFNPEIKMFEGHDGTEWGLVSSTVYVNNCNRSVMTSLTNNKYNDGSYNNFYGSFNNFFGVYTGCSNIIGFSNNFFGRDAGRSNTSGRNNNFFGGGAGCSNDGGSYNNFIGNSSGYCNIDGSSNNFIGWRSGFRNTSGSYNNFFGHSAGYNNTTGWNNNFFGRCTGLCNTTGSSNNFIGHNAGRSNTTGCNNNFFGAYAGRFNTTGCNNLLFGWNAGTTGITPSGLACITTDCNRIIMGNSSHNCAQIQIGWTTVSDCRDKCIFGSVPHGRNFLERISPIEYAFKDRETNEISDPEGKRRYGFSAQEVLEAEGEHNVVVSNEDPDKLQMTNDYMIPILVNAINELSQEVNNIIDENKILKDRILNLEQKII